MNDSTRRHIRKVRIEYELRHDQIVAAFGDDFREDLRLLPGAAGVHVTAFLRDRRLNDWALVQRAKLVGVGLLPLTMFSAGPRPRHGLVIGYGAIQRDQIQPGLAMLALCFRKGPRGRITSRSATR